MVDFWKNLIKRSFRKFWVKIQFFNQTNFCDLFSKIYYAPSLDNLIISIWPYFGVDWSNHSRGKVLQLFEYSKLFLQLERSCKLFNGLDDFKVALYVWQNHMDDDIHSDHSYLDTLRIPLNSTLSAAKKQRCSILKQSMTLCNQSKVFLCMSDAFWLVMFLAKWCCSMSLLFYVTTYWLRFFKIS